MAAELRVEVVVLAAGRSTRFGEAATHKLTALLGDVPVVRRSVIAAIEAGVGPVTVVTGAEQAAVEAALAGLAVRLVHAPRFADGMSASLAAGVEAVRESSPHAIVVALADQPTTRADAYRRIVRRWRTAPAAIVVPRYAGESIPSHPVLFSATVWPELTALHGDVGARSVIARDPGRVVEEGLEWPAPRDIDTARDLELAAAALAGSPTPRS